MIFLYHIIVSNVIRPAAESVTHWTPMVSELTVEEVIEQEKSIGRRQRARRREFAKVFDIFDHAMIAYCFIFQSSAQSWGAYSNPCDILKT